MNASLFEVAYLARRSYHPGIRDVCIEFLDSFKESEEDEKIEESAKSAKKKPAKKPAKDLRLDSNGKFVSQQTSNDPINSVIENHIEFEPKKSKRIVNNSDIDECAAGNNDLQLRPLELNDKNIIYNKPVLKDGKEKVSLALVGNNAAEMNDFASKEMGRTDKKASFEKVQIKKDSEDLKASDEFFVDSHQMKDSNFDYIEHHKINAEGKIAPAEFVEEKKREQPKPKKFDNSEFEEEERKLQEKQQHEEHNKMNFAAAVTGRAEEKHIQQDQQERKEFNKAN